MADEQKDTRLTRRAERRARAQAEAEQGEKKPSPEPARPAKPDEEPSPGRRQAARDRNQRIRDRAAADRRSRRAVEPEEEVVRGLDAGEMVDDALARFSHNSIRWLRAHATLVQWGVVLVVAGFLGWRFWLWQTTRSLQGSSDELMEGVRAEEGTVGDLPPMVQPKEIETRQQFNSQTERLKRAEELYRAALTGKASKAAATLARLGLASVLYDQRRFDEALAAYREVKDSPLGKQDPQVRLRATEGIGLCLEAKGNRDGALGAFHELENSDLRDYSALGLYQQARIRFVKGEKDQAKQLLAKLAEKTKKPDTPGKPDQAQRAPRTFVERAAEELEFALEPAKATSKVGLASAGSEQWSAEQIEQLRRLYQNLQKQKAGGPIQLPPGIPAPTPEPSPGP